jgi:transcriptional regulator with XRE-family HTH domain
MDTKNAMPHLGTELKTYLKKYRIHQAALARKMGINYSVLMQAAKRDSLQASMLWNLSHALGHNLFADIAQHLPEHYTKTQPEVTALHEKITALEHQNELLTSQLNLLKEVMRKD